MSHAFRTYGTFTRPTLHPVAMTAVPAWRGAVVQFDVSHNAIPLAFFAFTAMLQSFSARIDFIRLPTAIPTVFFSLAVAILFVSAFITLLRIVLFPPALYADFSHPRLANFFFLPSIIGPIALITVPTSLRSVRAFEAGFYILSAYQLSLALNMYGEWLFENAPTRSIYPLVFMQTIGFFLLSIVGAMARLPDQAFFMLSVGVLFWFLVFVTNFQHVSHVLDKRTERPQPAFFLFIAPPAQAAIAFVMFAAAVRAEGSGLVDLSGPLPWPRLAEAFLYIDLFLYLLMFRLFPTWWREDFALSWWAYVFPLSGAASAVILRYETERSVFWAVIAVLLSVIAVLAMTTVFCLTVWAFYTGRAPKNAPCLASYKVYYASQHQAEVDLEAGR